MSVRGEVSQKKARENQKTETFSIDAGYDLEVSSMGNLFSYFCSLRYRQLRLDLRIDFRALDKVGFSP